MSRDKIFVVGAAILVGNRCLIGRRKQAGSFGGLWEFPGGKLEPGETATQALRREIQEELGVDIIVGNFVAQGEAEGLNHQVILDVYSATLSNLEKPIFNYEHDELRFILADEMANYNWAPADLSSLPVLALRMRGLSAEPLPNFAEPPSEVAEPPP